LTLEDERIMMSSMRTTLTLEPDVARLLDEAVHREQRSRKQVVNDALRRALVQQIRRDRVRLVPHESAIRPGLDLARLNQLADEFEDTAILDAARRTT
jgi:predicted transcriptional regulator